MLFFPSHAARHIMKLANIEEEIMEFIDKILRINT